VVYVQRRDATAPVLQMKIVLQLENAEHALITYAALLHVVACVPLMKIVLVPKTVPLASMENAILLNVQVTVDKIAIVLLPVQGVKLASLTGVDIVIAMTLARLMLIVPWQHLALLATTTFVQNQYLPINAI